jgi:hypothetical protein
MNEKYAILDEQGGWFVNLVKWDGNLNTWTPPVGTIAKLASEVDFSSLPEKPEETK